MDRYRPASHYLTASLAAAGLALFSTWCGMRFPLAFIPAAIFVLSAGLLYFLATRPVIEVGESYLSIGAETIRWGEVERLDSTGWTSPLVLRLTLDDRRRIHVIYPGDIESCGRLLKQARRLARNARIDGIPYREYWGEVVRIATEPANLPRPQYRLLLPEDEEEVEKLYQRLKSVGHLDSKSSADDHQS